ncbi:unnamed protein product [Nezara viridula]|uniref:C2H2-type domain-containing protein n=1 Tax=Nezara viridula TaxID=85310 RepID=A0A9P0HUF8_NEZVI|nr:unnamed protein product [Nezara viridula]
MTSKTKIQRTYSCSVCGKKLSSSVALKSHLKTHSGIKSFCCEYCGVLYSTKQNLMAHLLRIHNINADSTRSCEICGKQFFRKCAFDTHYLIHLKQKPFKCHICHKYFRQKITRDVHVDTHTGDYKYSCPKCGKKFLTASKCKEHTEKKKGLCSDLLIQSRDVDFNLDDNWTDEIINSLKFDCRVTDKILDLPMSNSFNLNQEDAIEFFCAMPQCSDTSFKNKTLLKKHISRSHLSSGSLLQNEVSYESNNCGIFTSENTKNQTCEKPFPNVIQNEHSKRPSGDSSNSTEFSCTECYKNFKTLQGLEYHKRAHKGFYNFICDICGKLFIRNSHFVSHMKTHSNMRPYCCSICWKSYKSNKNLKEHVKFKHPIG